MTNPGVVIDSTIIVPNFDNLVLSSWDEVFSFPKENFSQLSLLSDG